MDDGTLGFFNIDNTSRLVQGLLHYIGSIKSNRGIYLQGIKNNVKEFAYWYNLPSYSSFRHNKYVNKFVDIE